MGSDEATATCLGRLMHCVRARSSWTRCRTETKALQLASPERVIAGAEQAEAVSSRRPGSRVEHRAGIG
jgi:hypothetical protein